MRVSQLASREIWKSSRDKGPLFFRYLFCRQYWLLWFWLFCIGIECNESWWYQNKTLKCWTRLLLNNYCYQKVKGKRNVKNSSSFLVSQPFNCVQLQQSETMVDRKRNELLSSVEHCYLLCYCHLWKPYAHYLTYLK